MMNVESETSPVDRTALDKALSNPLILENVLSCMDWETACECRKVSKLWYEYLQRPWRELAPSITLDTRAFSWKGGMVSNNVLANLDREESMYRWGGVNQYTNVAMGHKILDSAMLFINAKGQFITKLEVKLSGHFSMDYFKYIVFCKSTPNLKSLKFTYLRLDSIKSGKSIGVGKVPSLANLEIRLSSNGFKDCPFWIELLSIYTNLKKLALKKYSDANLMAIFNAVNELRRANQLCSLTSVRLRNRKRKNHYRFAPPFPLYESVRDGYLRNLTSISTLASHEDWWRNIKEMLNYLADKLKHLKIRGSLAEKNRSLRLPAAMPKLESIILLKFHLKNLNFLMSTPNLRKLYIWEKKKLLHSQNVIQTTELPNGICWPYMQTFACNEVVPYGRADISALHNWMPNLTTLKLHLNDYSFFAVCQIIPRLRRLYICHSKVTDYGYTGESSLCESYKNANRDEEDKLRTAHAENRTKVNKDEIMKKKKTIKTEYMDVCYKKIDAGKETCNCSDDQAIDETNERVNEEQNNQNGSYLSQDEAMEEANEDGVTDAGNEISDEDDKNDDDEAAKYALEKMYQQRLHEQDNYEVKCPYNAVCLPDLVELVIENCHNAYGLPGLVSTASSYCKTFQQMSNLRKVWIGNGVTSRSGTYYALDHGPYRVYNETKISRPPFLDQ